MCAQQALAPSHSACQFSHLRASPDKDHRKELVGTVFGGGQDTSPPLLVRYIMGHIPYGCATGQMHWACQRGLWPVACSCHLVS